MPAELPRVQEFTPQEAFEALVKGAVLIDVRQPAERFAGTPKGSSNLSSEQLLEGISDFVPDKSDQVLLICAAGQRSRELARHLLTSGYSAAGSVLGGVNAWIEAGLPIERPLFVDPDSTERYLRQLVLPGVGQAGQRRLLAARVMIIGAGGLGSPAALYLAAAGVGHIGIVDDDCVERSNLQRQILHRDEQVGLPKAETAWLALEGINPAIAVASFRARVTGANAKALIQGYNLVVDGSDNLTTRYLLNDTCADLKIPLIYGAVQHFAGQVSVFWPARPEQPGPCYRCLFPDPPPPGTVPDCTEAGVLGVLPGVVGTLQATEALKLITGIGEPLVGRLLSFDALQCRFFETKLKPDPACPCCGRP